MKKKVFFLKYVKYTLLCCSLISAGLFLSCSKESKNTETGLVPNTGRLKASLDLMSGNPILPVGTADPDILYANGTYYIYSTAWGPNNSQFRVWTSTNLQNFVDRGIVLDLNNVSWAKTMGWAPNCVYRNSKYYFYYTAEKKIGVAVATSPLGPFVDKGSALATGDGTDPIDPMVFVDTDGKAYMYWGNTTFNIQQLGSDMISLTGTRYHTKPSNYFEAPYVFKRNSTYYLCYSVNDYRNDDYHVEYATSSSPLGPWTTKGRITAPSFNIKSPGHNAVIRRPGCSNEWYFIYHRRTSTNPDERQVAVENMYFDGSGNIMPIIITNAGVIAQAGSAGCTTPNPVVNGTKKIVSKLTTTDGQQLVLDIPGCSTGTGAVSTWTPTSCLGQSWQLTYSDNYYEILSAQPTHYALDLNGCFLDRGTGVGVYDDLNNQCQRWKIEPVGSTGYFRIVSKGNGLVLEIANSNRTPGGIVQTWSWNGSDCQLWKFQ